MNINILYEDNHIIVCKKPAGVSSQTERGFAPDMVSILMNHLHEVGTENPYIAIIHRLDKPVSGVMVYAKTKEAAAILSKDLAKHSFSKKYYAIVMDNTSIALSGSLENYLLHDVRSNTSIVADSSSKDAKLAILNYKLINRTIIEGIPLALLDIELLTGRHHQIRVQLSHTGCPILGDTKYNKMLPEKIPYKIKKTGLALCAYSLSFTHPVTGDLMEFTDIPKENIWKEMCKES